MAIAAPTPGIATAALVLGILGAVLCWIPVIGLGLLIAAIVCGHRAQSRIRRTNASGAGFALTGVILGYVFLVFALIIGSAVMFVIVTKLAGNQVNDQSSSVTFSRHDSTSGMGGTLTVVGVQGPALDYNDLDVRLNGVTTYQCETSAGAGRYVQAGDVLTCSGDGPYTLVDEVSNTVLYTVQFHS